MLFRLAVEHCGRLDPGRVRAASRLGDRHGEQHARPFGLDRKSGGEGKRVDLGGRRIIKKKKIKKNLKKI